MKNIVKKIRHWLIRKLGGYTEQFEVNAFEPVRCTVTNYDFVPFEIERRIRTFGHDSENLDLLISNIKRDILYKVGEEIEKEGCIKWEIDENPQPKFWNENEPDNKTVEIKGAFLIGIQRV